MFTGLIQERGFIVGDPRPSGQGGVRLVIGLGADLAARLGIGASLAVSGVCLTVVEMGRRADGGDSVGAAGGAGATEDTGGGGAAAGSGASWDVVVEMAPETLARTTLGGLRDGARVNLEPPLRAGDPLGGHLVQGHVDGTAAVVERRDLGEHRMIDFAAPPALAPFLVEKGSVCVDGVSLTVAGLTADRFAVTLIPHTLAVTTLGDLQPGGRVNLEVDVLAKYVQRMLAARGLVDDAAGEPAAALASGAVAPATLASGAVAPVASGTVAPGTGR
jgi:riboflavin synthase